MSISVTIILTSYNHEKYIAQTIESIINQTFPDRELLIGDDSPNNNTRKVISRYAEDFPSKIKARHHDTNLGIVGNINFLMGHVSINSKYIAFIEGDDIYSKDNIEKKIQIFQKYKDLAIVYNNFFNINSTGDIINDNGLGKEKKYFSNETVSVKYMLQNIIYVSYSTLMINKKYISNIPNTIASKHNLISDRDLFFRLSLKNKIYGISTPLTFYRIHEYNTSHSKGNEMIKQYLELNERYLKEKIIKYNEYKKRKGYLEHYMSNYYITHGDRKKAIRYFILSICNNPNIFFMPRILLLVRFFLPCFINKKI